MTSLRHYHLGCGESLHSVFENLRQQRTRTQVSQTSRCGKTKFAGKRSKKN